MVERRRDFIKMLATGALSGESWGAGRRSETVGPATVSAVFNIRDFGAESNSGKLATEAINAAMEAAHRSGGGTVFVPSGTFGCGSIRLQSSVTLYLDQGATLLAADIPASTSSGGYDPAEPEAEWAGFQDYGHNHWHDSLLWGEDLHDIAILGPGRIWGEGLGKWSEQEPYAENRGLPNKAIALKNCRNVLLRDFSILKGGHIGILATGVDNLTVDHLTIDTRRDGIDVDCCRNVRIANCSINSPWDDAICLKSSFALGYARPTENVTISNCYLTGTYEVGSMLDATWKAFPADASVPRHGRIKFGTESNGGLRNVCISSCVFEGCQGIALESVDGGAVEDITVTGITMRHCASAPIFLRLGARLRGPAGTGVGRMRRILLSQIVSYDCAPRFASILAGIPGHPIEDVKLSDLYLHQRGGEPKESALLVPDERVQKYPDPNMFGTIPASGFFLRHLANVELSNVEIRTEAADARPAIWAEDVQGLDLFRLKLPTPAADSSRLFLRHVSDLRTFAVRGVKDMVEEHISSAAV